MSKDLFKNINRKNILIKKLESKLRKLLRSIGKNGFSRLYKKNILRCGPTSFPNWRLFIGDYRVRKSFFI